MTVVASPRIRQAKTETAKMSNSKPEFGLMAIKHARNVKHDPLYRLTSEMRDS